MRSRFVRHCTFCIVLTERCPVEGARDTIHHIVFSNINLIYIIHRYINIYIYTL